MYINTQRQANTHTYTRIHIYALSLSSMVLNPE